MVATEELPPLVVPDGVTALVRERANSAEWQQISRMDRALAELPQQEMPLRHTFTKHLYGRSIFIPAGTVATTRIHRFENQTVVSVGAVSFWGGAWQLHVAGEIFVTAAGTRRIVFAHTDAILHTFHVTDETDPDKLVDELTYDPMELGHLNDLTPRQIEAVRAVAKPQKKLQ